jgi:hypothetical protein
MEETSMRARSLRCVLFAALTLAGANDAGAAPPGEAAGIVKVADGQVSIERNGGVLAAAPGSDVHAGDVLVTGANGRCGVTFRDNSLLSLGANSRFAVDGFRFDATTHDGGFEATLERGKLAIVSGKLAKHSPDAMKLRTPSSILGVRGTEFVVEVGP